MPRSHTALPVNGLLDPHHPMSLEHGSGQASRRHDITPEVFHRFMTYESSPLTAPIDFDIASLQSFPHHGSLIAGRGSNQLQSSSQRVIRALPLRSRNASLPSPSVVGTSDGLSRALPQDQAVSRFVSQVKSEVDQDPSAISQSLSNGIRQLRLSPQDKAEASDQLQTPVSGPRFESATLRGSHGEPDADQHFRFPSLPAKLTDDGFHYRQRAAQFILLCSQEASAERLSMLNRLSLPLVRRSSLPSKHIGNTRRSDMRNGASLYSQFGTKSTASLDEDGIIHSHCNGGHNSDDESEYLDFDACRSVHLGNKKKRKSSRASSPGVPVIESVSHLDKGQHTVDAPLPISMSSSHQRDFTGMTAPDRAFADRTNTVDQQGIGEGHKQTGNLAASSQSSSAHYRPFVRLPPRQSSGEHQRSIIRSRVRLRLARAFDQRRLELIEAHERTKKEQQAQREASAQQAHLRSEPDAPSPTSPERKAPPKRSSKAGKRAQVIRGGSSSAKSLTIAEIRELRSRASTASAGPQSVQKGTNAPLQMDKSPSPARKTPQLSGQAKQSTHGDQMDSQKAPPMRRSQETSSVSPDRNRVAQIRNPGADTSAKRDVPQTESDTGRKPSKSMPVLPTSSFDFRMSSAVTLRLRELRSQLDAATRNLSDTARAGDTHAVAQALSEAVAAPPLAPARPLNDSNLRSSSQLMRRSDTLPAHAPPWVRHALDFEDEQEYEEQQQQQANSRQRQVSPSVNKGRASAAIPSSVDPPLAAPQSRTGTLTPARKAKPQSAPAAPHTTAASPSRPKAKAANGRRPATRKPAATSDHSHKHGAACKHGFAHGHGRQHGTNSASGPGSNLFTDDDWICVFCEYELYYGEAPLMLRACRNRKKLVEKKSKARTKAKTALQKKSSAKPNGCTCQHHDDHLHDHGHHDHDHDHDHDHHHHGCEHDHDHGCDHSHSHSSAYGSDDHHHHHDHGDLHRGHSYADGKGSSYRHGHHDEFDDDDHRDRCDCGNSIHSSDFDEEDKRASADRSETIL